MIDTFGQLHLPQTAPQEASDVFVWAESTPNIILVLVSTALVLIVLKVYFKLFPTLLSCFLKTRPNIELEKNFHSSATRSICSAAFLLPFILMVDRFRLYSPSLLGKVAPGWSVAAIFGVVVAFLFLRFVFYPIRPNELRGDESKAAHCFLFTCFTVMVPVMLLSLGGMLVFNVEETVIRYVLLGEIALFYFISIVRTGLFLGIQCSALGTISYLCALEIIPAVLVVISDMKL